MYVSTSILGLRYVRLMLGDRVIRSTSWDEDGII